MSEPGKFPGGSFKISLWGFINLLDYCILFKGSIPFFYFNSSFVGLRQYFQKTLFVILSSHPDSNQLVV